MKFKSQIRNNRMPSRSLPNESQYPNHKNTIQIHCVVEEYLMRTAVSKCVKWRILRTICKRNASVLVQVMQVQGKGADHTQRTHHGHSWIGRGNYCRCFYFLLFAYLCVKSLLCVCTRARVCACASLISDLSENKLKIDIDSRLLVFTLKEKL